MIVHAIYHAPFEGLGYIADWIKERNHGLTETHIYRQERLPDKSDFDMLVIMGGPMNVYEEQLYPWLKDEKVLIRRAIEGDKRVLGICLGAQLVALALDSKVYRNGKPEIGWFPVYLDHGLPADDPAEQEPAMITFHWHGDTFDLPDKAKRLAYSDATVNQAFSYENRILAIQFHPEVGTGDILRMIQGSGTQLKKDVFVQTANEMTAVTAHIGQNRALLGKWLDRLETKTLFN